MCGEGGKTLGATSHLSLTSFAGKPNGTPNFVARKQHGRSDRGIIALGELCLKLYEEFGPEDRSSRVSSAK